MRKKILIIVVLFFCFNCLFSQESKIWDYPVKPGTAEWSNLKTYEERLDVYNIPDKLLEMMNTIDLVQTCLNYPEFRLIMTRNSLQQGYDYLKSIFNGFRELEKRNDAGKELIKEYNKLNPIDIKNFDTPVKRGEFAFKLTYIEILLAQNTILTNLDDESKKELIKASISNYEATEKMPENYATFGLLTPALILGRLLDVNGHQGFISKKLKDDNLRAFVENTILFDAATLSDILSFSKTYLIKLENE